MLSVSADTQSLLPNASRYSKTVCGLPGAALRAAWRGGAQLFLC